MKTTILIAALLVASEAHAQVQVPLGSTGTKIPFVAISSTDHLTEKTDATVSCRRSKNGADGECAGTMAEVSDGNNPGEFVYTLAAGDVDTVGSLTFRFSATGMDTTRALVQVGGVSIATGGITSASIAARGTLQAAGALGATLAASEAWGTNALANKYGLYIVSADTNAGVYGCITANTSAAGANALLVAWPNGNYPTGTITYDLIPDAGCGASASAVWSNAQRTITGFAQHRE